MCENSILKHALSTLISFSIIFCSLSHAYIKYFLISLTLLKDSTFSNYIKMSFSIFLLLTNFKQCPVFSLCRMFDFNRTKSTSQQNNERADCAKKRELLFSSSRVKKPSKRRGKGRGNRKVCGGLAPCFYSIFFSSSFCAALWCTFQYTLRSENYHFSLLHFRWGFVLFFCIWAPKTLSATTLQLSCYFLLTFHTHQDFFSSTLYFTLSQRQKTTIKFRGH